MQDRKRQIQLLARANEGRRLAPAFLGRLSDAVLEPVSADSLETLAETDSLFATFREGYQQSLLDSRKPTYRRLFVSQQKETLLKLSSCIGSGLPTEYAFLLVKDSHHCGAVRLRFQTVLSHAASIIALDGDSVCLVSGDRQEGLLLDHNFDDLERNYELAVWGTRWAAVARQCDSDCD